MAGVKSNAARASHDASSRPAAIVAGIRGRGEQAMRAWVEGAAAAAGAVAVVGLGTAVVATLVSPVVFPVVVAAGALYAFRIDGR
jgi:fatty acid desaturase